MANQETGTFVFTLDDVTSTYTYPATTTNDPNAAGNVFNVGNGTGWTMQPMSPAIDTESLREMLGLPVEGCIVCSAEAESLICPLCIQAINEARKGIVQEMVGTMLTEMKKGKPVAKKKFHVAYTLTGTRTHAVEFFGGGRYDSQALCGISDISPSRTRFARVRGLATTCSNCAYIYRIRGYEG